KVFSYVLTYLVFDKGKVLPEVLFSKTYFQELVKAGYYVIVKPFIVEYGYNIIRIGQEACGAFVLSCFIEIVLHGLALAGKDQPFFIEAITAEHATYAVGDKLCEDLPGIEYQLAIL